MIARPYQGIERLEYRTTSKRIGPGTFELSGAGAAEDEEQSPVHHQGMHHIQQFRHLLDFIYYDQRTGRFVLKRLPKGIRIQLESLSHTWIQQIVVNGFSEPFFQEGRFAGLACSKQEHGLVQLVLNVEYSLIHKS